MTHNSTLVWLHPKRAVEHFAQEMYKQLNVYPRGGSAHTYVVTIILPYLCPYLDLIRSSSPTEEFESLLNVTSVGGVAWEQEVIIS